MKTLADFLPDFQQILAAGLLSADVKPPEVSQAESLEAFETGYKAGWDDAVAAAGTADSQVTETLAQNLQDLSFTYHEAVAHVMQSMGPLLRTLVEAVLPDLGRQTLALHVLAQIEHLPREICQKGVVVSVTQDALEQLQPLLEIDLGLPIRLEVGPNMLDGQALLSFDEREMQVDLSSVLKGLDELVEGFLFENEKELKHGT